MASNKEDRVAVRCTTAERARWEKAAAADKRVLADWIRIQLNEVIERSKQGVRKDA